MMNRLRRIFAIVILELLVASTAFMISPEKRGLPGQGEDVQGSCLLKVKVVNGRFVALEVVEGFEALGMNTLTLEGYLKALIENQSFDSVDAVSGATMGCDLIKKALFMALKQAR
ncbi:MAG: hypothetical protein M0C28_31320 [Candidatus Moduliflexus flocculans]|nr:hypothetical protein [Candidatus Moduliflexus flocculans]